VPDAPREKPVVGGSPDIAIALRYDGDNAPRVVAKGRELLAEEIIRTAQQAGVPLYPDAELAMVLSQIPLGEEIPENLYRAIAEVIAFAYILAGKVPEGFNPPGQTDIAEDA